MAIMQGLMEDERLAQYVRQSLYFDERIDQEAIQVHVSEGIVRLKGFAKTLLQRWAAEDAARETYGVRGVVNEIQVSMP